VAVVLNDDTALQGAAVFAAVESSVA